MAAFSFKHPRFLQICGWSAFLLCTWLCWRCLRVWPFGPKETGSLHGEVVSVRPAGLMNRQIELLLSNGVTARCELWLYPAKFDPDVLPLLKPGVGVRMEVDSDSLERLAESPSNEPEEVIFSELVVDGYVALTAQSTLFQRMRVSFLAVPLLILIGLKGLLMAIGGHALALAHRRLQGSGPAAKS